MTGGLSMRVGAVATIGVLVTGCAGGSSAVNSGTPTSASSTTTTATGARRAYPPGRNVVSFDVNGVRRSAIVVVPVDSSHPAPLVFVFHGHGGRGANIERRFDIEGLWPDGIAATANLSSQPSGRLLDGDPVRSMFMAMGERDPIVPYANQAKSIPLAQRKLGIDPSTETVNGYLRTERGQGNVELATYVYP